MSDITEYVIDAEGRFHRQRIIRSEINPTDAVVKALINNRVTRIECVEEIAGYGPISVSHTDDGIYCSIPIQFINLRCEFRNSGTETNPVFSPKFIYDVTSKSIMNLKWDNTVDSNGMVPSIRMVTHFTSGNGFTPNKSWLFAVDISGNAWRMPLANLYANCELCTGEYDGSSRTLMGAVRNTLTQLESSKWNSDLYYKDKEEDTNSFFRFVTSGSEFKTSNILGSWTEHCEKVSNPITSYIVI